MYFSLRFSFFFAAAAAVANAQLTKVYTMAEVAQHNTATDCWLVIDGKVYDSTPFLSAHPGGVAIITRYAGQEVTKVYNMFHKASVIKKYGPMLLAGYLEGNQPAPAPAPASGSSPAPATVPVPPTPVKYTAAQYTGGEAHSEEESHSHEEMGAMEAGHTETEAEHASEEKLHAEGTEAEHAKGAATKGTTATYKKGGALMEGAEAAHAEGAEAEHHSEEEHDASGEHASVEEEHDASGEHASVEEEHAEGTEAEHAEGAAHAEEVHAEGAETEHAEEVEAEQKVKAETAVADQVAFKSANACASKFDKDARCSAWERYCSVGQYVQWMQLNCAKTCCK